jgi:hypothetical protein
MRPRLVVATALVSLLTMPLTAVWFMLLGGLLMAASAAAAATRRSPDAQVATLGTGVSIAAGLLAGPAVYLLLALLTT